MYYQITFTLDKKIRGKFEMPHTIELDSKSFLNYITEKNRNILMYFKNKKDLYINMPNEIAGHIIKRKDYVDFMDFTPACLSLKAVVSEKIKDIFENLHIKESEYILKQIKIKGIDKHFYLLFVPIIRDIDFVYPKCKFVDMLTNMRKYFKIDKSFMMTKKYIFLKR